MLKQSYHIQEEIIEWRRDFHMHPELGFKEFRTSAKVADELEKLGYRVRRNVGRTGVVADWGDDKGPCIAIRANMDALPILEANDVPYKSQNDGTMTPADTILAYRDGIGRGNFTCQRKISWKSPFLVSAIGRNGRRRRD